MKLREQSHHLNSALHAPSKTLERLRGWGQRAIWWKNTGFVLWLAGSSRGRPPICALPQPGWLCRGKVAMAPEARAGQCRLLGGGASQHRSCSLEAAWRLTCTACQQGALPFTVVQEQNVPLGVRGFGGVFDFLCSLLCKVNSSTWGGTGAVGPGLPALLTGRWGGWMDRRRQKPKGSSNDQSHWRRRNKKLFSSKNKYH